MGNRIIKESICTSEKIAGLTDFQFRLWVHLITYVDDFGRGDARPSIIRGKCFPLRERLTNTDIAKGLAELADIGCVNLYTVGGRPYLCLPGWEKHQTVRRKISKIPAPEECNELQQSETSCDNLQQVATDCSKLLPVSRIQNPESRIQNPEVCGADKPRSNRFVKPTVDEVAAYCQERGNSVNAQRFVDYYTANGWMVGKSPMKDWKAAVRNWEKSDGTQRSTGKAGQAAADQCVVDPLALAAIQRMMAGEKED